MKEIVPMVFITVIVLFIGSYVEVVRNLVYGKLTQFGRGQNYNPLISEWKKLHPKGS